MRLLRLFLPIIALLATAPAFALDAAEIYKRASESVVVVLALDANNQPVSSGSGFFVGDGKVIATNYHVVEDAAKIHVELANGETFETPVLEIDRKSDLALLGYPHVGVPLALSGRSPKIGEEIVVIGNPKGLERSLSTGIVSGIREDEGRVVYQLTAPISSGSSGSPVLDEQGIVLGMATFILEDGQNLNFAFPAIQAQRLLGTAKVIAWTQNQSSGGDVAEDNAEIEECIEKQRKAAKEYFQDLRARAVAGDSEAQYEFGTEYFTCRSIIKRHPEKYSAEKAKWYRRAAEQGHAEAQSSLGYAYWNGWGVPEDDAEGVKWFRRAAEQGHMDAQHKLGIAYSNGVGIPKDRSEAVKWIRRAADQGNYISAYSLVRIFKVDVPYSFGDHIEFARYFAEQGDVESQYGMGNLHNNGTIDIPNASAEAAKWYRRAAVQGHARAQNILGDIYYFGRGVSKDFLEAAKWYRRSAEQGAASSDYLVVASSQLSLGYMYDKGKGVPQDDVEAVKWYRRAAERGDRDAQNSLGVAYANGKGVSQNKSEAVKWYIRAAEQNDAYAQANLGRAYARGEGVPQNGAEAVKWLLRAAEQGHASAPVALGLVYFDGEGIPKNNAKAYIWFSVAAAQGDKGAGTIRDSIAKNLPAEILHNAQQEAARRYKEIQDKNFLKF